VTSSSDTEAPSDITAHCAQEGIKGGNKRHKCCEVGGSGVRRILTATCGDNCPAWPPVEHFKRLLKEACPNHAYPIKHKLNDCGMMRSVLTSGSLT
jgi:hypothetical protein